MNKYVFVLFALCTVRSVGYLSVNGSADLCTRLFTTLPKDLSTAGFTLHKRSGANTIRCLRTVRARPLFGRRAGAAFTALLNPALYDCLRGV